MDEITKKHLINTLLGAGIGGLGYGALGSSSADKGPEKRRRFLKHLLEGGALGGLAGGALSYDVAKGPKDSSVLSAANTILQPFKTTAAPISRFLGFAAPESAQAAANRLGVRPPGRAASTEVSPPITPEQIRAATQLKVKAPTPPVKPEATGLSREQIKNMDPATAKVVQFLGTDNWAPDVADHPILNTAFRHPVAEAAGATLGYAHQAKQNAITHAKNLANAAAAAVAKKPMPAAIRVPRLGKLRAAGTGAVFGQVLGWLAESLMNEGAGKLGPGGTPGGSLFQQASKALTPAE